MQIHTFSEPADPGLGQAAACAARSLWRCRRKGDFEQSFERALSTRYPDLGLVMASYSACHEHTMLHHALAAVINYANGSSFGRLRIREVRQTHGNDGLGLQAGDFARFAIGQQVGHERQGRQDQVL